MNREEALENLLRPITWDWSSSLYYRRNLVYNRREEVEMVMPFLTDEEKIKAEEWLKTEKHRGLWE